MAVDALRCLKCAGKGLGYDGRKGAVAAIAFQNGNFASKKGIAFKYKDEEKLCVSELSGKQIKFSGDCEAKISLEKDSNKDKNKEELEIKLKFTSTTKEGSRTSKATVEMGCKIKGNTPDHLKIAISGCSASKPNKIMIKDLKLKGDF